MGATETRAPENYWGVNLPPCDVWSVAIIIGKVMRVNCPSPRRRCNPPTKGELEKVVGEIGKQGKDRICQYRETALTCIPERMEELLPLLTDSLIVNYQKRPTFHQLVGRLHTIVAKNQFNLEKRKNPLLD